MENLIYLLPLLACPVGMLLMMWLMGRGMRATSKDKEPEWSSLVDLKRDRERLTAEIGRREADEERSARSSTPSHA